MAWHDAPKHRNHPDVQLYLDDLGPEQRTICELVRDRLKQDLDVLEFIAWGVPCYWKQGPLAYTSAAKNHVTLGFFRGIEIGMGLEGTGKSPVAKHVWQLGQVAPTQLDAWIDAAFRLDQEGD